MHPKQDAPCSQMLPVFRQFPTHQRPFVRQKVMLSCPSLTGDVPTVTTIRSDGRGLTDHIVSMFCLPMPNSQLFYFWIDMVE